MKTTTVKLKSHVSSFTLRLGPLTTVGRLVSVQAPQTKAKGSGSYKLCTPTGKEVKQVYKDSEGDIWQYDALSRYYESEDGPVMVNPEAVKEASKSSLPKDLMELSVHKSADTDGKLFSSDKNSYVFEPDAKDPANKAVANLLVQMIEGNEYIFLSLANVRNYDNLYRLKVWRGYIVLEPQLYPENINPHEAIEVHVDGTTTVKANALLSKLATSYDPEAYKNKAVDRYRLIESAGTTDIDLSDLVKTQNPEYDLISALDAALEM